MKLVIGNKNGKTYQMDLDDTKAAFIIGKKAGDEMDGASLGLPDYTLLLTGGSDSSGFPMRAGVTGSRKIKALLRGGIGFHPQRKGQRKRKVLRGFVYSSDITQVNAKVVKQGSQPLDSLIPKSSEEKK